MNTEQLGRLLTALETIATNTARIADALELGHLRHVTPSVNDLRRHENLNPKGPYA